MAHATQAMRPPPSLKLKERALIQMSKRKFFATGASQQADQENSASSNTNPADNEYLKTHHAHFHKILVFLSQDKPPLYQPPAQETTA